jgi:hypothetical protein
MPINGSDYLQIRNEVFNRLQACNSKAYRAFKADPSYLAHLKGHLNLNAAEVFKIQQLLEGEFKDILAPILKVAATKAPVFCQRTSTWNQIDLSPSEAFFRMDKDVVTTCVCGPSVPNIIDSGTVSYKLQVMAHKGISIYTLQQIVPGLLQLSPRADYLFNQHMRKRKRKPGKRWEEFIDYFNQPEVRQGLLRAVLDDGIKVPY